MFNLFILLITVLHAAISTNLANSACLTRPQSYWILNTKQWPNKTGEASLCQVKWYDIMQVEPTRMSNPLNQYWVIATHQYITASLNNMVNATEDKNVITALVWLGDSLERACANLSEWRLDMNAYNKVETLRDYNNQCTETSNNVKDTLYYIRTQDLLVIPANISLDTNKTLIHSLLFDEYRFRQFAIAGSTVAFVGIPVLTCIIILLLNKRYKYHLSKRKAKKQGSVQIGSKRSEYASH